MVPIIFTTRTHHTHRHAATLWSALKLIERAKKGLQTRFAEDTRVKLKSTGEVGVVAWNDPETFTFTVYFPARPAGKTLVDFYYGDSARLFRKLPDREKLRRRRRVARLVKAHKTIAGVRFFGAA